jgi:hypothetical protein
MAYSTGSVILDDDYNIFATGNAAGTGDNNVANLNTVWGTGTGDKGWGQSGPVDPVSAGSVITATQWATLLTRMTTEANHQGSTITPITNPVAGETISAYAALSSNITTVFNNRNNAAGVGSTITANGVATRSTSWTSVLTATHTVTFSSGDAMRYFFNAGGRITWTGARTGGTADTKNTSWSDLLTACGTLNWTTGTSTQTIVGTSYTGTTKIGGSGSPTTLLTGTGFYDLTTSNQEVFKQFAGTYLYTMNFVSINVKLNATPGSATVMTLEVRFDDSHTLNTDEPIDGTLTSTITAIPPSTSFLTATWGTPTLTSSITGS